MSGNNLATVSNGHIHEHHDSHSSTTSQTVTWNEKEEDAPPNISTWNKMKTFFKAVNQIKPRADSQMTDYVHDPNRPNSFLEKFGNQVNNNNEDATVLRRENTFTFSNGIPIYESEKDGFKLRITTKYCSFNPEGNVIYAWLAIVTIAWLYNIWILIARQAFIELQREWKALWYALDYICDFIYLLDIFVQIRTGFLKHGLLVFNTKKMAIHYCFSWKFVIDILSLLPLDLIYIGSEHVLPLIRVPRFLKAYRAKYFMRHATRRTAFPNLLRVVFFSHILMLLMHWFACFYYMISEAEGKSIAEGISASERGWAYPFPGNRSSDSEWNHLHRKYLHSIYWSCLTLTTIGEKHSPETNLQYVCTLTAYFLGIFLFATVVGQVGNVISTKNADRLEFERLTDNAKHFMKSKNVPSAMQRRVMRWYDYSWSRGLMRGTTDVNSLGMMPDMLKVELAIHVNMNTLRKVSIFKLVQPEFLYDLVLKMKSYIFTPGDLICRKGEIAKEMYIISHGVLEVVGDRGEIFALLRAGDFFGEIGVLNITGGVNKRVANVRSVGYSEVFALAANDVTAAMEHYPEAKNLLMIYGRQRLQVNQEKKESLKELDETSSSDSFDSDTDFDDNLSSVKTPDVIINHVQDDSLHIRSKSARMRFKRRSRESVCQHCNKDYVDEMAAVVMRCIECMKMRNGTSSSENTLLSEPPSRTHTPNIFAFKKFREQKHKMKQQLQEKNSEIKELKSDIKLLMEKMNDILENKENRRRSSTLLTNGINKRKRTLKKVVNTITAVNKIRENPAAQSSNRTYDVNEHNDLKTNDVMEITSISATPLPSPQKSVTSPRSREDVHRPSNRQNQTMSTVITIEDEEQNMYVEEKC